MGGLIETDKMLMHVESCTHCREADSICRRCGEWKEMAENVMDWQCEEGAFEDGQDICDVCDRPIPDGSWCTVCNVDDDSAPGSE